MAPATVLVVDDDPVILKLLEVNFEMEGVSVVRAADGAEGLERAREVLPDIVVLDVMMPRMTGYEVAKALREDDLTAHIPIIFVTARAQSSDVERGMELGVDDYVTKPFDPLDLIARVNTLLARRAGPGDGADDEAGAPSDPPGIAGAPEGNGSAPAGAVPSADEVPPAPAVEVPPVPTPEAPVLPGEADRGDGSQL
ncbi:MAG TPA: response regulator [Acidimicrobiia bacterium]|nr:response regulator [Acidimicrobiia bacterium]